MSNGRRELEVLLRLARELPRHSSFEEQVGNFGAALAELIPLVSAGGRLAAPGPGVREPSFTWNGSPTDVQDYFEHYARWNPLDERLSTAPGSVWTLEDTRERPFGSDPYTADFLPRLGCGHVAVISHVAPDGGLVRLSINRSRERGDFTARERNLFLQASLDVSLAARRYVIRERFVARIASGNRPFASLSFDDRWRLVDADLAVAAAPFLPDLRRQLEGLCADPRVRPGHLVARGLRLATGISATVVAADARSGLRAVALLFDERAVDPAGLASTRFAFTEREREIAGLLVQGLGNRGIAHRLGIGANAVKWHVKNLFRKTSTTTRTELASLLLAEIHGGISPL